MTTDPDVSQMIDSVVEFLKETGRTPTKTTVHDTIVNVLFLEDKFIRAHDRIPTKADKHRWVERRYTQTLDLVDALAISRFGL